MKVKPPGVSWVAAVANMHRTAGAKQGNVRSSDKLQLGRFEGLVRRIVAEQNLGEEIDPARLKAARQFVESGGVEKNLDGMVDAILEDGECLADWME